MQDLAAVTIIAVVAVLTSFAMPSPARADDDAAKIPAVTKAVQAQIDANEIAGAVTAVVTKNNVLELEALGYADIAAKKPMRTDSIFWIKSMSKPVTAVAVLMLQDDGKLNVDDPVSKFIPEFAELKTPSGKPAKITIAQMLAHTSGLGEAAKSDVPAKTLADLVLLWLKSPMQFEPGEKWKYTQSGINAAARIVEVVSGQTFDKFLDERLFKPLGMNDTTFYPSGEQLDRVVTRYKKNKETGALEPEPARTDLPDRNRPPLGNEGLYSTAPDYARFCEMLLNGGSLDGKRYLRPKTVKILATPRTRDMKAGFVPGSAWAHGVGVVTKPQGVTAILSPGTYGHGGAFGTQAWIDPARGVAYVLMIQRTSFGTDTYRNGDDTAIRRDFQQAASDALSNK
jgi:CubicO group peptidase (beta-lactamase class C family)